MGKDKKVKIGSGSKIDKSILFKPKDPITIGGHKKDKLSPQDKKVVKAAQKLADKKVADKNKK
jgi:hypothetical protein